MAELTATRTVAKRAALSQPVNPNLWQALGEELAAEQKTLVDLWGDTDRVHMAVTGPDHSGIRVASLLCPDKRFPSIGRAHAPAIRLERAARDVCGVNEKVVGSHLRSQESRNCYREARRHLDQQYAQLVRSKSAAGG